MWIHPAILNRIKQWLLDNGCEYMACDKLVQYLHGEEEIKESALTCENIQNEMEHATVS